MRKTYVALGSALTAVVGIVASSHDAQACSAGPICYTTTNSVAIWGADDGDGYGVEATSDTGYGLYASSASSVGAYGASVENDGVYGESEDAYASGVEGYNTSSGVGVGGNSASGIGVYGTTGSSYPAILGNNTSDGIGVEGESSTGYGGYFTGKGVDVPSTGEYYQGTTCVAGCGGSDRRLKQNIEPLAKALDTFLQLNGVTFEWKDPASQGAGQTGRQVGFIAQDVEKVFPQWVSDDNNGMKRINVRPMYIAALTVESLRTLKGENDALRRRVEALEGGRPVVARLGGGGLGFAVGGVAIALAVLATRRKRAEPTI